MMQMTAVANSSNIQAVGYLPGHRVLQVAFTGARIYHYLEVPPETWEALQTCDSAGRFVAGFIKGSFDYEAGEYEPCPEEGCEYPDGHDEEEEPHGKRTWDE